MNSSRAPVPRPPPPKRPPARATRVSPPGEARGATRVSPSDETKRVRPARPPAPETAVDDCDAPTVVRQVPIVPSRPIALDAHDLELLEDAPEPEPQPQPQPEPQPQPQPGPARLDADPILDDWLASRTSAEHDDEPVDPRVFRSSLRARGVLVAMALMAIVGLGILALVGERAPEPTAARPDQGAPLVPSWQPSVRTTH